jgi:hypothetical protein
MLSAKRTVAKSFRGPFDRPKVYQLGIDSRQRERGRGPHLHPAGIGRRGRWNGGVRRKGWLLFILSFGFGRHGEHGRRDRRR